MTPPLTLTARWGQASAGLGGVVWAFLFLFQIGDSPETTLIQRVVLFGILIVVPLALSLVPPRTSSNRLSGFYRAALIAQPLGAVAAVASFLIDPGVTAGVLSFPWFVVTALIALEGVNRLRFSEMRAAEELSIIAGLLLVPVAAAWMIVSRLGLQLFGYGDTIILLTAVHFHFAAYAVPILGGLTGRKLVEHSKDNRLFKIVPVGVVVGTLLVALGITFSPKMALIGAVLIAVGVFALATIVMGQVLALTKSFMAMVLLVISSLSSFVGMVLACIYAYSIVAKRLVIDIPQMAMTHGLINAFGFVFCGLIAWTIIDRATGQYRTR